MAHRSAGSRSDPGRGGRWSPTQCGRLVSVTLATTGISVCFRDHADPHMTVLLDSDGPFNRCSHRQGPQRTPTRTTPA